MNTLPSSERILSVTAHPDDLEMHHSALLSRADKAFAIIASDGEGTTLNYTQRPIDVARERRGESERSLALLGITGTYLALPDGQLHTTGYRDVLTQAVISSVLEHDITAIASLGESGYCGHSDHVASHTAATHAQDILAAEYNKEIALYALDHSDAAEIIVPVDRQRKLAAVAIHATQFQNGPNGAIDPTFWATRADTYDPLLERESYSLQHARVLAATLI